MKHMSGRDQDLLELKGAVRVAEPMSAESWNAVVFLGKAIGRRRIVCVNIVRTI